MRERLLIFHIHLNHVISSVVLVNRVRSPAQFASIVIFILALSLSTAVSPSAFNTVSSRTTTTTRTVLTTRTRLTTTTSTTNTAQTISVTATTIWTEAQTIPTTETITFSTTQTVPITQTSEITATSTIQRTSTSLTIVGTDTYIIETQTVTQTETSSLVSTLSTDTTTISAYPIANNVTVYFTGEGNYSISYPGFSTSGGFQDSLTLGLSNMFAGDTINININAPSRCGAWAEVELFVDGNLVTQAITPSIAGCLESHSAQISYTV